MEGEREREREGGGEGGELLDVGLRLRTRGTRFRLCVVIFGSILRSQFSLRMRCTSGGT